RLLSAHPGKRNARTGINRFGRRRQYGRYRRQYGRYGEAPQRGHAPEGAPASGLAFEEALQLVRPTRVPQLAQRLGLDLADPLAGDVELLADFLQRVVRAHLDAETHAKHLGLARGER